MNVSARFSSDRYAYEKALLDDWFRRTFCQSPPRSATGILRRRPERGGRALETVHLM
jgi:hypothetical protein